MQVAITQVPLLAKQQIAEETFQVNRAVVYAFDSTLIVGPYQSIAEVPGMLGKLAIVHAESQGAKILNGENSRCAGVSFTKGMNLPYS